jgi:putative endonuclease
LKKPRAKKRWTVYILRCADGSLYTGITRDVERRLVEHNSHALLAARYTRSRRPVVVVYSEPAATRSAAARREYQIKQKTRSGKEELIAAALLFKAKGGRRKAKVKKAG